MNEFLITFRESLEAALIVGIIFTVLDKNNLQKQKRTLWISVIAAIIASAILGVILYEILERAGASLQALLEGIFMYITALLLFYVIFWMSKTFANRAVITDQTNAAIKAGSWGIFLLVFFAILREGFETALFLVASTSIDDNFSYTGFFGGIILAVLIGFLIIVQGKKIPLRSFFKYTSLLLVFFAAGMVAYGTHEMHEYFMSKEEQKNAELGINVEVEEKLVYNIFKPKTSADAPSGFWYTQVKDTDTYIHLLNDKGTIGVFFKGLFGYNSNPILIEVILWFAALLFGLFIWRRAYK